MSYGLITLIVESFAKHKTLISKNIGTKQIFKAVFGKNIFGDHEI